MKVDFVEDAYLDEFFHSGQLIIGYPPGTDSPDEFDELHTPVFESLQLELAKVCTDGRFYVSFEFWGDFSIGVDVDYRELNPVLISFLVDHVKSRAPMYTLWCVVSNFDVKIDTTDWGRFVFNNRYFLVTKALKANWIERVGEDVSWEPWPTYDTLH